MDCSELNVPPVLQGIGVSEKIIVCLMRTETLLQWSNNLNTIVTLYEKLQANGPFRNLT